MNNGLTVYRASAGAGKTFTLAVEYISLLVVDPGAYRTILAVTFTNKATAEMKERILQQLYGLAYGLPSADSYLKKIKENTDLDDKTIRVRSGYALSNILHDYSHFKVETIDSFFQTILKNLARELDLTPNLKVDLDQNTVRDRAVDMLLEHLTSGSQTLGWIIEFIENNMDENKSWNITGELKRFASNVFDESYIERGKELRNKMKANPALINEYRFALQRIIEDYHKELNDYADRFFKQCDEIGLSVSDFSYAKSGVWGYFARFKNDIYCSAENGDRSVVNSYVLKAMEEPAKMFSAANLKKNPELSSIAENVLSPILTEAETIRREDEKKYVTALLSMKDLFSLRLLNLIDENIHQINTEENRFLLSETPSLLQSVVQQDDASFVFEKMGVMLQHIMIDEFQDTSKLQWNNFYNLLMECLSQGKSSLIVGDEKQSIYRWRNGDWRILQNIKNNIKHYKVDEQSLDSNFRSEKHIVEFNKQIFVALGKILNDKFEDEFNERSVELSTAYSEDNVEQNVTKSGDKGYVSLNFMVEEDKKWTDDDNPMLADLVEKVRELLAGGVDMNDITILIRKNKYIPVIAKYFADNMTDMNIPIVSDEAFELRSSVAVQIIISALQNIANPADTVSLVYLISNYQKHVYNNTTIQYDQFCGRDSVDESLLPPEYIEQRTKMSMMPLYELIETIYSMFNLKSIENQDGYILAFFDKVREFLMDGISDITSFIQFWNDKMCTSTVSAGSVNGIRIMSIHKSKGLQFHTVLMPYCDWNIISNGLMANLLWCDTNDKPFDALPLVPIKYSKKMVNSSYKDAYKEETLLEYVDALNELYVAFTRPKCNLFVWGKRTKGNTVSTILADYINMVNGSASDKKELENVHLEIGEVVPSEKKKTSDKPKEHNPLTPEV